MTDLQAVSDPDSSISLVFRARSGDHLALELLCSRYLRRLQAWAHGRLPPYARGAVDTQDLAQDTLAKVIQKLPHFEPQHDGGFEAYVFRAMINRVLDEIRRAQRKPAGEPLEERPAHGPTPFELAVGSELRARYDEALLRLNEMDRNAIIARIELEMSWAEVTQALGKPSVPAAQMTVSRALVKLAREMCHER